MRSAEALGDVLLQLLVLVPPIALARRSPGAARGRSLAASAAVFALTSLATDLPATVQLFAGQSWNWVGKLAAGAVAGGCVAALRPATPASLTITTRIERAGSGPIAAVCGAYVLLRLGLWLASAEAGGWDPETLAFQVLLPGPVEELIFRGLLLSLATRAYSERPWTFAGVPYGWAVVLTSLLFAATHGVFLDGLHVRFEAFPTARALVDGFLFALLTVRTKSLVPAIVLHDALNLIGNH